jgi:hypothetical protein
MLNAKRHESGCPLQSYRDARKPVDESKPAVLNRVDLFFQDLGPGLITGCADDDRPASPPTPLPAPPLAMERSGPPCFRFP